MEAAATATAHASSSAGRMQPHGQQPYQTQQTRDTATETAAYLGTASSNWQPWGIQLQQQQPQQR